MSNETKLYLMILGTFALTIMTIIKSAQNAILIQKTAKNR